MGLTLTTMISVLFFFFFFLPNIHRLALFQTRSLIRGLLFLNCVALKLIPVLF